MLLRMELAELGECGGIRSRRHRLLQQAARCTRDATTAPLADLGGGSASGACLVVNRLHVVQGSRRAELVKKGRGDRTGECRSGRGCSRSRGSRGRLVRRCRLSSCFHASSCCRLTNVVECSGCWLHLSFERPHECARPGSTCCRHALSRHVENELEHLAAALVIATRAVVAVRFEHRKGQREKRNDGRARKLTPEAATSGARSEGGRW